MILLGLGANLPSPVGMPIETLCASLQALEQRRVKMRHHSRLWRSAPIPPSGQPWFVNAVVSVDTILDPVELLAALHDVEAQFGRTRAHRWEARTLDIDLLDYEGKSSPGSETGEPVLPHPRMGERAFVLFPLKEVAPHWQHPISGRSIDDLLASLPPGQAIEPAGPDTHWGTA